MEKEKSENTKLALLVVTTLIILVTSVTTTVILYQLLGEIKEANEKSTTLYNRINEEIEYDIYGVYNVYNSTAENSSYEFDDYGTVKYKSVLSMEGKYVIDGNKIKITYEKAYDSEGNSVNDFEKEEEINIVSNNVLMANKENAGKLTNLKYTKEK